MRRGDVALEISVKIADRCEIKTLARADFVYVTAERLLGIDVATYPNDEEIFTRR